jgi:hypothetical protein
MDSISSYPGFQDLPSGIKQLLLVSELHYLQETRARAAHAAQPRSCGAESWNSQLMRTAGRQLAGKCFTWGKQTQLIPTLAAGLT